MSVLGNFWQSLNLKMQLYGSGLYKSEQEYAAHGHKKVIVILWWDSNKISNHSSTVQTRIWFDTLEFESSILANGTGHILAVQATEIYSWYHWNHRHVLQNNSGLFHRRISPPY